MVVVLPQGGARSRFLFDWSAAACLAAPDQSLTALTGQRASFTHNGIASAPDATGRLISYATNLPAYRWDRDPVTGLMTPGVQLEGARTNLFQWSQALDQSPWVPSTVTINPNQIAGPDGTLTCDVLVEAVGVAEHLINQVAGGPLIADNTICTVSASIKPGRTIAYIGMVKKDGVSVDGSMFDLTSGTLFGGAGPGITPRIVKEPNGFYRCSISGSVGVGIQQPQGRVQPWVGSLVYPGDPNVGLYITDLQFEIGASPSSRIITGAGGVTRAGSLLMYELNVPPMPLTVYSKRIDLGQSSEDSAMPWAILGPQYGVPYLYERSSNASVRQNYIVYSATGSPQSVSYAGLLSAYGESQEVLCHLPENGYARIVQSTNGGPDVIGSLGAAVPVFPPAWSGPFLTLGSGAQGYYPAPLSMQVFRIAAGVRSMDYMRRGGA